MSDFVAQIVLSFNQYILIFLKSFDHLRVVVKIPHEKRIFLESSSSGSERDNDWKQFNHDDINSKMIVLEQLMRYLTRNLSFYFGTDSDCDSKQFIDGD